MMLQTLCSKMFSDSGGGPVYSLRKRTRQPQKNEPGRASSEVNYVREEEGFTPTRYSGKKTVPRFRTDFIQHRAPWRCTCSGPPKENAHQQDTLRVPSSWAPWKPLQATGWTGFVCCVGAKEPGGTAQNGGEGRMRRAAAAAATPRHARPDAVTTEGRSLRRRRGDKPPFKWWAGRDLDGTVGGVCMKEHESPAPPVPVTQYIVLAANEECKGGKRKEKKKNKTLSEIHICSHLRSMETQTKVKRAIRPGPYSRVGNRSKQSQC